MSTRTVVAAAFAAGGLVLQRHRVTRTPLAVGSDTLEGEPSAGAVVYRDPWRNYRRLFDSEIADFNNHFNSAFSDEDYDTVGGLVVGRFGRVPKRGESLVIDGFTFQVLRADSRKIHSLLVEKPVKGAPPQGGAAPREPQ